MRYQIRIPQSIHSTRNATIGSTLVARLAGIKHAANAASIINTVI
jgi:hypothetical protein